MSNVLFNLSAYSNITYNREVVTGITVEKWAEMDHTERVRAMNEALWDSIEVNAIDEETGEYLD